MACLRGGAWPPQGASLAVAPALTSPLLAARLPRPRKFKEMRSQVASNLSKSFQRYMGYRHHRGSIDVSAAAPPPPAAAPTAVHAAPPLPPLLLPLPAAAPPAPRCRPATRARALCACPAASGGLQG
jgi:hypothetical protein